MNATTKTRTMLGGLAAVCVVTAGVAAFSVNAGSASPDVGMGDNASRDVVERAIDDAPAQQRRVIANHSVSDGELVTTGRAFAECVEAEFRDSDAGAAGLTLEVELDEPTEFSTGVDYRLSVSTPTDAAGIAAHGSLLDTVPAIEEDCRETWIDAVEDVRLATALADETLVAEAEAGFLSCLEGGGVVDVQPRDSVVDVMRRTSDDFNADQTPSASRRSAGDGAATDALMALQDCFGEYPILNEVLDPTSDE